MNRKLVEESWKRFRENVIHPDAREDQVREMKMAFYGGCWSAFNLFMAAADDNLSPNQSESILTIIHNELVAFKDAVDG
jgi:hypothetical protein